ncbi:MAG: flagellar biosynthesis anti-sigma factor FlgM [Thermodesulfobacteriota bacterium]
MKIDESYRDLNILGNAAETMQKKKAGAQVEVVPAVEQGSGEGADVRISNTSLEYSKVAEWMDRESPERAERIQEIQRKIQEGTYEVDPAKVAEKILAEALAG